MTTKKFPLSALNVGNRYVKKSDIGYMLYLKSLKHFCNVATQRMHVMSKQENIATVNIQKIDRILQIAKGLYSRKFFCLSLVFIC